MSFHHGESFNEAPKNVVLDFSVDRNFGFVDRQQPKFRISVIPKRKKGKALEWTTLEQEPRIFYPMAVIMNIWNTNKAIRLGITPPVFSTLQESMQISELEHTIMRLIEKGSITEEYAVDMFRQEQIFNDNFEKLQTQYKNKEIVVCGDEIFIGDSFDEALQKATAKYPNRPFYAYSSKKESITF